MSILNTVYGGIAFTQNRCRRGDLLGKSNTGQERNKNEREKERNVERERERMRENARDIKGQRAEERLIATKFLR